jgi:HSP20 family molecular chaperone IbpA
MAWPANSPGVESTKDKSDSNSVVDHLKKWEQRMTDAFRDTFKNLKPDTTKSAGAVTADLREQNNTYTLRLNLPERSVDKAEVTLKNGTLRVVAPEEGKLARYEQSVVLGNVAADAKPQIDRKAPDHLIVVTVPKEKPTVGAAAPSTKPDAVRPFSDDDYGFMKEMDRMRHDMDRIYHESLKDIKGLPASKGIFDQSRFDSSYKLEDKGNVYIIRDYLPERDVNNVNVKVEGLQLRIEANSGVVNTVKKNGAKEKGPQEIVTHESDYTQLLTLPGPVDATKMKVDRKDGMILVTLPKAVK